MPDDIKNQAKSFIEVLNLNHKILKENRTKDVLSGLLEVYAQLPKHQKSNFWKQQFNRIVRNKKHPYRQFLLIYIGNKIGIN